MRLATLESGGPHERETGWQAEAAFEEGLARTIDWYRANLEWTARVKSGEYQSYYDKNYAKR